MSVTFIISIYWLGYPISILDMYTILYIDRKKSVYMHRTSEVKIQYTVHPASTVVK